MTIVENHLLTVTGGIDTHLEFHVAAAVDSNGGVLGVETFDTTTGGFRRLVAWLAGFGNDQRDRCRGHRLLRRRPDPTLDRQRDLRVVEVDRPNRQARHRAGKTDAIDAIAAARAALTGTATGVPKSRTGNIEAIRVLTVARRSAASDVRLTHRVVEIFHAHSRVASHVRTSQCNGHVTVNEHMPKAHQRYADATPASLVERAGRIGSNTAILVERMMRDRPHPEQGYRSAMGILSLARRYEAERLEAACERALAINAITYSSVTAILKSGLDRGKTGKDEPAKPTPSHTNIRGSTYYQ